MVRYRQLRMTPWSALRSAIPFVLYACAPHSPLLPDATPDASADSAGIDAVDLRDAASLRDVTTIESSSLDVVDVVSQSDGTTETGSDAGGRPDINARHGAMEVIAALRLTCTPQMAVGDPRGCDSVKTRVFEGSCYVQGMRTGVSFSPFACGVRCFLISAGMDGRRTSVIVNAGGALASGGNAQFTHGLEWVDGTGQRRQNFYARVQVDANGLTGVQGISGVPGLTEQPEYADVYALGCPVLP